jgi:hypothetical protein
LRFERGGIRRPASLGQRRFPNLIEFLQVHIFSKGWKKYCLTRPMSGKNSIDFSRHWKCSARVL